MIKNIKQKINERIEHHKSLKQHFNSRWFESRQNKESEDSQSTLWALRSEYDDKLQASQLILNYIIEEENKKVEVYISKETFGYTWSFNKKDEKPPTHVKTIKVSSYKELSEYFRNILEQPRTAKGIMGWELKGVPFPKNEVQ